MIELLNTGAYLVNGIDIIPDTEEGRAELKARTGAVPCPADAAKETIAYGILKDHNVSGNMENLQIKFDKLTSHDITFVGIIQTARASGLEKFPVPYVLTNCHNSLCAVGGTINEDDHMFGLTCAKKYGGIYVPPHQAVIHQFAREMLAECGAMILGSDSHTRYGALGTMAIGEGGGELAKQLLKRTYDVAKPGVVAIYLDGEVQKGVGPQDVALAIIGATFGCGYVKNKVIACEACGFKSSLIRFEEDVTEDELLAKVKELNDDDDVDGYIVQLPLPKHIDEQKIIMAIDYRKDVDGFHPVNVGRMAIGLPCFISATPLGILTLLRRYGIETSGRKCVILGRSNIVGKPMAQLMMQKQYGDSTVTVCHSHSKTLKEECREADIIIAAIGRPDFVTADMVKEGAVVIDVGTTRVPDATRKSGFRLNGDVKFDEVAPKCSFITPVPGGVGPMTICSLMKNTLAAGKKEYYK